MTNTNAQTPRQMEALIKPRCAKPGQVEALYEARDKVIAELRRAGTVTLEDIQKLDRTGRSIVASELWQMCTPDVREALLDDLHHFVRSAAEGSQRSAVRMEQIQALLAVRGYRMEYSLSSLDGEGHSIMDLATGESVDPPDDEVEALATEWSILAGVEQDL